MPYIFILAVVLGKPHSLSTWVKIALATLENLEISSTLPT